jgi:hypothetical protein
MQGCCAAAGLYVRAAASAVLPSAVRWYAFVQFYAVQCVSKRSAMCFVLSGCSKGLSSLLHVSQRQQGAARKHPTECFNLLMIFKCSIFTFQSSKI